MTLSRRNFLAASGVAVAATIIKPESVVGAPANSVLRYGLIGCGGRGGFMTDVFKQNPNYKIVAATDYFEGRAKGIGAKFELPEDRVFSALSGYKRLLDCDDVDVAAIMTPPGFHPTEAAAAVDAGKHVYLSKPIAVDVPGTVSIGDSAKKATAKNLAFIVDFQTRACPLFREALKRVHDGDIGRVFNVRAYYPWAVGVHNNPVNNPDEYLASWYQSIELSGDCIVEQDVHTLDVATWILGADPIKAVGTCGRTARQYGNINDHFEVTYTFPGDAVVQFSSAKFIPGVRDEITTWAWGTGGVLETNYMGDVYIRGNKPYDGGSVGNLYWSGAVTNAKEFYEAIVAEDFSNPTAAPSVRTNLTAILGRTAARSGKELTWDAMLAANEKLEIKWEGLKK